MSDRYSTDGDKRAEHDRRVAAFLADLTDVCRKHGMALDLVADEHAVHEEAQDAIDHGDIGLRPVLLDEHTSAGPDAAWQVFNDGQIWWQP